MTRSPAWALVPVKPFATAKSRLASALAPEARRDLARSLLANTLNVLANSKGVAGVAVVSRDPEVESVALAHAALTLSESASGLDAIVNAALADLASRGAGAALVIMADLPDLCADDVERMLALGESASVVLAPDVADEGTNALFLAPPGRMPTCFGRTNSFRAHLDRAASLGIEPAVLRAPSLSFDLDSVDDLPRLKGLDREALRRASS